MAARPSKISWTEDDLKKLNSLLEAGASAARASAVLKRSIRSVQQRARQLGKSFLSVSEPRKQLNSKPNTTRLY